MLRLCKCGKIVDGKCKACYRETTKQTTAQKGYDNKWRRLSEMVRKEQPLCPDCEQEGKAVAATEVHHIIPIKNAPHLRLDRRNLVALCHRHHEIREANV